MVPTLPPLYALRAFECVARMGSVTLAGQALHVTQSTISKHLKTLETHFGCKLFLRTGPRLALTPQGEMLAVQLRQGFQRIEAACALFHGQRNTLRLKAPSTLTMRWLLGGLHAFRDTAPGFEVQASSIWMDIDAVDFATEPYDCAILLGTGHFGAGTRSALLFDEWLIPICAPALVDGAGPQPPSLIGQALLHPSPDRRDWRRWLEKSGHPQALDLRHGQVFDTLEQGNTAAMAGHGIAVGDLALCQDALAAGQLVLPWKTAVGTGDGYYLVWPDEAGKLPLIERLLAFLRDRLPRTDYPEIRYVA
ncbi:LysR substrate-binding domain-containing protein [Comamonas nitrativorans]|uniref:LysR substrate-binding domain-containing protein n=1 Tax=Comamonas nitrativorans TaxID=108437 RepID=A0ABV9GZ62_9BURK